MQKTKVYIKENSWLARLGAAKLQSKNVALTMRRTIHLWNVPREVFLNDIEWLCHELVHVKQYKKHGSFVFLIKYFFYWLRFGYKDIPFEIEARQQEYDQTILKDFEIVD
jgi:hypothetical protein